MMSFTFLSILMGEAWTGFFIFTAGKIIFKDNL